MADMSIVKGRFRVNSRTIEMNKFGNEKDDFSKIDLSKSKHESLVLEGFDENAQTEVNKLEKISDPETEPFIKTSICLKSELDGKVSSSLDFHETLLEQAYVPPLTAASRDLPQVAERGRLMASKHQRLVFKDGNCNVTTGNITKRRVKYLADIFTTLVDMKWRYNFLMFVSGFLASWLFFALCWFLLAIGHGDHLNTDDEDWKPCVSNVFDFITALLFSIETQQTIGYGFRGIEAHCPLSAFLLMLQSCTGVFIQSLTAGIIFAKLSQPKRRAHTLLFSRKAVICNRDGEYCLLFRVGNMRKSHFVGTSIRAFIVKDKFTKEGECIPLWQNPLDIHPESCKDNDFVFLVWPVTVVHKINKSSPLWDVSMEKLQEEHFEIIVILEGIVESTGMTTQVRTSYVPREILWGHRLAPLLTYQKENGQYKIDYSQFHAVIPILSMPDHSAREHEQRKKDEDSVSKTTDMDEYNFGYISPDGNGSGHFLRDNFRMSVIKRMKGGVRLRSVKSNKRDPVALNRSLHRRLSASTSALRALKAEQFNAPSESSADIRNT